MIKDGLTEMLSGDAGLSASKTLLSKLIRGFEKIHTGDSNRSHAFCGIGDTPPMIIEALVRVRVDYLDKYKDQDIELWRAPLDEQDRAAFRQGMLKAAGDSYGWGKIFLASMDSVMSGVKRLFVWKNPKPVFFFSRTLGFLSFKDCSQLLVWGWHKFTKFRLKDENHKPISWKIATPDYCQDLFCLPHNQMKLYYKQFDASRVIEDERFNVRG